MKKITKLDEYQEIAMKTLYEQFKNKDRQLEYGILALCGEVGELANMIKHSIYYENCKVEKWQIIDELSDVLWYIACIADSLNIKLSKIATHNVKKIMQKQKTFQKEDS